MNDISFDFDRTAHSFFRAIGQDDGNAQVNCLTTTFVYLGTRFITACVLTIDPIHAVGYELTVVAVDLLVGPIFADTHNERFRNFAKIFIPFTAALIFGCNPLATATFAITSFVARTIVVSYLDDNNCARYFHSEQRNFRVGEAFDPYESLNPISEVDIEESSEGTSSQDSSF